MLKKIILISICTCLSLFARDIFAEAMTYEAYSTEAKNFCETTAEDKWNTWSRLVPVILYPELKWENINAWMSSQIVSETSPVGRANLSEALDPTRIGSYDGIRTLQVAQSAYHAQMNTIFDCAVIESRMSIIEKLQNARALQGRSEIIEKMKKELDKLKTQRQQCLPDEKKTNNESWWDKGGSALDVPPNSQEVALRMVNTATLQYCHYRKYLSYLDSNLNADVTRFMTEDLKVGTPWDLKTPQNTEAFHLALMNRQEQIRMEIYRADRVLPRAIQAYQEMERTYATHLLLVIIYDDYVRLRANLNKYLSATSQLFEKANNAMSQ